MPTPSAQDLTRLRRKIGSAIPSGGSDTDTAFTDDELEDIWDEAAGVEREAVILCLEILLSDAAKFNDYTAGQTSEKRGEIFDHLKVMLDHHTTRRIDSVQMRMVGLLPYPPRAKDEPHDL